MGLVMVRCLSTQLWSAHFSGRSLSDTKVFPKLVSPCRADHFLLVAWEGHRANCQNLGRCWERHGSTKSGCCARYVKQQYKSSPCLAKTQAVKDTR